MSEYKKVSLGDFVIEEKEPIGDIDGNGLPVLGVTNIEGITVTGVEASADKSKYLHLKPLRFAYNPYRINVGSIGLSSQNQDGIVSPAYVVFKTKEALNPRFLLCYFKSPDGNSQINFYGNRGSVRSALRFGDLAKIQIPLPPLSEQLRILEEIEKYSGKLQIIKKINANRSKELNATWGAICSRLFRKSERYGLGLLSEVATLERGKFSHRPRNNPIFFGGNHPWIQIGEIESANKHITKWKETLNDEGLAISKKFPKGTLLVSIAATIGAVGILDFDCCVPDSIVGVTPKKDTHGEYLYYYFTYLRSHLEKIAPESARKNINLEILSSIKIPTPPLEEQIRIAKYLDQIRIKIDEVENIGSVISNKLGAVLPSITNKAFKGELG